MSKACKYLHAKCKNLRRIKFPFHKEDVPSNGVYLLFQVGEKGHGWDRIVRVGSHTGDDQLRSRLQEHFLTENKDRSIFRKNIGRAILAKSGDEFLKHWNIDLTTRASREKYECQIDLDYQAKIEEQVSDFIRSNFTFVFLPILNKNARLDCEKKLISTVSLCTGCRPSSGWLGQFSPKDKIRESGLWLINNLYKIPYESDEIRNLLG